MSQFNIQRSNLAAASAPNGRWCPACWLQCPQKMQKSTAICGLPFGAWLLHSSYIINIINNLVLWKRSLAIYTVLSQSFCMVRLSKMYPLRNSNCAKWNIKTGLGALKNIVIFKDKLALLFSFLNSRPDIICVQTQRKICKHWSTFHI